MTKAEKYAKDCYHVRLHKKEFDPRTGQPLFKPFEQYFTQHGYRQFLEHPQGLEVVEVLHDPTKKEERANSEDLSDAPKGPRVKKAEK